LHGFANDLFDSSGEVRAGIPEFELIFELMHTTLDKTMSVKCSITSQGLLERIDRICLQRIEIVLLLKDCNDIGMAFASSPLSGE
jgi:hypothetical protein